jgi:alkylation response protein AidB-like acyl-CoA dehydrogenase
VELDFTPEQDELRATVRAVLQRACPIGAVRALVEARILGDEEPALAGDLWSIAAGLDWPALNVALDLGGVGLEFVELAVVAEELGRALAPGPVGVTLTQFIPALQAGGWDDALRRVAAGQLSGSLATAEVGGGFGEGRGMGIEPRPEFGPEGFVGGREPQAHERARDRARDVTSPSA